jgi:hypothetical protein
MTHIGFVTPQFLNVHTLNAVGVQTSSTLLNCRTQSLGRPVVSSMLKPILYFGCAMPRFT